MDTRKIEHTPTNKTWKIEIDVINLTVNLLFSYFNDVYFVQYRSIEYIPIPYSGEKQKVKKENKIELQKHGIAAFHCNNTTENNY